ncbi:hypothetical protein DZF91_02330 [Actinomadura logoneensis]|uniref:Secreted protein n=1 Tax=Actinomadura logoneensis TaxID=2293572 RepID=A0A372JTE1_9ACTN|nr:hypothetical protein [Actinomadura logoneensis]RFU43219.1 hypothetical protein DZF91_02330 [Actinomadura logoneensis]
MRKLTRNTIIGGSVAVAALGLTALPAAAAPTSVTITAAGSSGSSVAISGINSGNVTAKDTSTGAAITCTKGTASGTSKLGTGLPLTAVASVTSVSLSSPANAGGWCSGPAGLTIQVTANTSTPWTLDVTGVTSGGVTAGKLNGVKASIVGSDNCHATVTANGVVNGPGGSVTGSYNNSTHALTTGGTGTTSNLKVATVDANCDPTLINAGDSVSLNGTFVITPALVVNAT